MSSKKSTASKRVVVFGGAGSIGSELVRQISVKGHKVYVVDNNETGVFDVTEPLTDVWGRVGDIRDYQTVKDVFEDFKPQVVFNCAAYKHVPLMEYTPLEAIQTNVLGHYNLIHCAKTLECVEKFVFVSTDKAVNARSIMGATKNLGEIMTLNQGKGYIVVRFGNVMGSRGSLFPIWQRQVDEGKPLAVTDRRMERYMMSIPEAVELVIEASELGQGGEVFVLDMGKKIKIAELAEQIVKASRYGVGVIETGMRPGETLSEELMSVEETGRAVKEGRFFVIR